MQRASGFNDVGSSLSSLWFTTGHAAMLQERGLDTVDANRALGLPDDCREYTSVANILADLDVKSIKLMV